MLKPTLLLALLLLAASSLFSQATLPRLKVFIDCPNTWCDLEYMKSEINVVDFVLDNTAADVHVLVTSQPTGSGGDQYQLIFFGQQGFRHWKDTLQYRTSPNPTDFERRALQLSYLKRGLIPLIVKTGAADKLDLSLKTADTATATALPAAPAADPWKAWVLRIGAEGNLNADANYTHLNYNGNLSANRITDDLKVGGSASWGKNRSTFAYEDNGAAQHFVVNNHNWGLSHYLVKSMGEHWSWAYELKYSQNTFSNNKGRVFGRVAAEYNLFPYKEVNNKLFTLSYGLTARKNHYFDTTIYSKTREVLYGQRATAYLSLTQKWGHAYGGVSYQNYWKDWKLFNLGLDVYTSVRITGGLSFYLFAFGGLTRDQVFLVKGSATPEEVLAKRRQLASGYHYYSSIGINYRFGSKLNNVVNPRFDRSSAGNDD